MKNDTKNTISTPQTALKAIRAKCLSCVCDSPNEVRLCEIKNCPLYKFRSGKNPNIKRTLTDAQKQAQAVRLRVAREKKEVVNG